MGGGTPTQVLGLVYRYFIDPAISLALCFLFLGELPISLMSLLCHLIPGWQLLTEGLVRTGDTCVTCVGFFGWLFPVHVTISLALGKVTNFQCSLLCVRHFAGGWGLGFTTSRVVPPSVACCGEG